jgi:hypothetical protein
MKSALLAYLFEASCIAAIGAVLGVGFALAF